MKISDLKMVQRLGLHNAVLCVRVSRVSRVLLVSLCVYLYSATCEPGVFVLFLCFPSFNTCLKLCEIYVNNG
jgi:hypothetical protein